MRARPTSSFAFCLIAAASGSVVAQEGYVNYSLSFAEVSTSTHAPVANPNGLIEPGESAKIIVSVNFTPVGTALSNGRVVAGLAAAGFGFSAPGYWWSDMQFAAGFFGNTGMYPISSQRVYQPIPPPGGTPISTHPIASLWSAVWTPASYSTGSVFFGLGIEYDNYTSLLTQSSTGISYTENIDVDFGAPMFIQVVPAPQSAAPMLGSGSLLIARRRRT